MANDNTLNIEVSASVDGLKKGLTEAEIAIKGLNLKASTLTSELKTNALASAELTSKSIALKAQFDGGSISASKYESAMSSIANEQSILASKSKILSNELSLVNKNTTILGGGAAKMGYQIKSNAVPSLTSFSQVIQDAPYGIQGVANNITQLTSQFGYLSQSTGGAGNALKAMASSLAGPAGILLAVSVVTSLLVSFGDELFKSSKAVDANTLSNLRLNDALRKQMELRQLLKDELTLATSIAKAEAKLAGKSEEEQYSIGKKFAEARIATLDGQVKEAYKIRMEAAASAKLAKNQENEDIQNLAKKAYKDELELEKSLKTAKAELRLDSLNELIRISEKKSSSSKKIEPKVIAQPFVTAIEGAIPIVNESANGFLKTLTFGVEIAKNTLEPIASGISNTLVNMIPKADVISERTASWLLALQEFNTQANSLIQDSIAGTFSNLGDAIGEAMAKGTNVFAAAGNAIITGIGSFLGDLGKMMIKYGVAALAYSIASKALLNPLTAAPAAGALIAAGTALAIVGSAIKNSVSQNGSSSGADYSSSSNSSSYGSSTSYSSGSSSGGTYVFEIAGTKLIGVLKNTLDRNISLGGSTNLKFS